MGLQIFTSFKMAGVGSRHEEVVRVDTEVIGGDQILKTIFSGLLKSFMLVPKAVETQERMPTGELQEQIHISGRCF